MNTPITTLTSLSALCEDYGRKLGESGSNPSPGPIQSDAFRAWLQRAEPGACLEYHRGLLSLDRSPESNLSDEARRALSRVADLALDAAEHERVHLVQRRNGPFDFSYLAIKASPKRASPASMARPASFVPEVLAA